MIKVEQLKQEAKKSCIDKTHYCIGGFGGNAYCEGYIDSAKPREKRIEELELKIKKLTQHLEPQAMTALFKQVEEEVEVEQRLKELEKENAELKETNKSYEKIIDNSSATLMKEKLKNYKQLTKAKEIIKGLLELGSIGDGDYTYVAQAEQFLKEVSE